ncbi:ethylene-responsive transcription factor erf025, partial [Phtheirospermum japonicum]
MSTASSGGSPSRPTTG